MHVVHVVGARPNFMKAAPLVTAINRHNSNIGFSSVGGDHLSERIEHTLVHTGQHYDELMSGSFFNDLNLPAPDIHLGVGPGSTVVQTAEIMTKVSIQHDKAMAEVIESRTNEHLIPTATFH